MQLFSNYAQSYLVSPLSDTDIIFDVAPTDGGLYTSPTGNDFELLTLTDGSYWEVVKLTSRSNDTLTVVRGWEGVARAWGVETRVKASVTKDTLDRLLQDDTVGAAIKLYASRQFR